MADEQLLAQLNKTLQSEYRTIFQYVQNSYMLKGMRRPALESALASAEEDAEEVRKMLEE